MQPVIDDASPEPPSEQLRRQVAAAVQSGELEPGHRLPTVRALATDLGLAPGTVAKAYRALEADGVVETAGRAGTRVRAPHLDDAEADDAAARFVEVARRRGLSREEAVRLVEQRWTR